MRGSRWVKTLGVLGSMAVFSAAAPLSTSPVADAVMQGDRDAVLALIEQGADVNQAQGDGMTALHWASEHGDAELVEMLLEAGADVRARTRLGAYEPLHLASRKGAAHTVGLLLEAGSDPNAPTETGAVTPLHFAAASGNMESVASLLDHGAEVNVHETTWDQTPLIFAAARDNAAIIDLLIQHGADMNAATRVEDIPTREAVDQAGRQARNEMLRKFREEDGAGDDWRPSPAQVQAAIKAAHGVQRAMADEEGLEGEEEAGEEEILGYAGLVGAKGGLTALHHAVREGNAEAAKTLIASGADINRPAGDGTSPILLATLNGHFDLATELLEHGADPTLASEAGATPLYAAINLQYQPRSRYPQPREHELQETEYLELMEALLEAGADPNARLTKHLWYMSFTFDVLRVDTGGATPFWRAAYATDVEAMKLLAAYGGDPHVPTLKPAGRGGGGYGAQDDTDHSGLEPIPDGGPGVYAIHAASGVGYGEGYAANAHRHVPDGWVPAVRFLIEEMGVDVNARDHNGYNALHHAAARGDVDLIRYLVEQGADVTALSRSGQTTADMANSPVQRVPPFPRAVALLESLGSHNNDNCVSC